MSANMDSQSPVSSSDPASPANTTKADPAGYGIKSGSALQSPLVVCCVISLLCYVASYIRMPVVPRLAIDLGISPAGIGRINAAFFLTAGLSSFPLGRLSDLVGKKPVAMGGLLFLSAGGLMLAFSSTFMQLVVGYVLLGFGMAAFGSAMMSLVSDLSSAARLGRAYGWYTLTLYLGMSLGPALGGSLAEGMALSRVLLLSAVLTVLVTGVAQVFLPATKLVSQSQSHSRAFGAAMGVLSRNRPLLGCWLATLGACFSLGMFLTFYPLYAYAEGLSTSQVGITFLFHGVGNGLIRLPSGYLSDSVGDRRLLVLLGLAGCSVAMAVLGLANTTGMANLGAATLGLSLGVAFPSLGASIGEVVPRHLRGAAMGGFNACIFLGMLINALLMGTVIEAIGYANCFWLSALANGLLAGLALTLMRGMREKRCPVV
jgi:MFS family permease